MITLYACGEDELIPDLNENDVQRTNEAFSDLMSHTTYSYEYPALTSYIGQFDRPLTKSIDQISGFLAHGLLVFFSRVASTIMDGLCGILARTHL